MITLKDKHVGVLVIEEPYEITGMVAGDIIVKKGGVLTLRGMCTKSVTLEEGSEAALHGMVNGDVVNDGGTLTVFGMINGALVDRKGKTVVSPGAAITKRGNRIGSQNA